MDHFRALDVASEGFAAVLAQVTEDDWARPSVNSGWSVRDLVNHVVGGNRRYVLLLSGAPTSVVEELRNVNHLSDDPARDFESSTADVIAAFSHPGSLDVIVHHRLGDRSGHDLLAMRINEHALHGWDLARSIGADDTISADVVETLLDVIDRDPTFTTRSSLPGLPAGESTGQQRLLLLTGRRTG